jgi:alpha-D-ribose 1-methylphosphonate 5-triphosphate diphosphatase
MLITNARVVTATEDFIGSVEIRDGRIASLDSGTTRVPRAEDWDGDFLLPGLVELHTDNLEKHLEPRPGVRWPAMPALIIHDTQVASSGITTVFDAMGIGDFDGKWARAEGVKAVTAALRHAREQNLLRADHFLHIRCELACDNMLEVAAPYLGDPTLRLLSIMDHTPGQRQWMDVEKFRTYTQRNQRWSDEYLAEEVRKRQNMQIRNSERNRRELLKVARDLHIPLASHDDTLAEHIDEAVQYGISISEFPTTAVAASAARAQGLGIIMGAPNLVRGESHSGNISALDLARLDLLDCLSSDYVPHALLHASFLLRDLAGWSIARGIATSTRNPARLVGLDDRGEIAIGQRADFVRVRELERVPVPLATWREAVRIA